MACITLLRDIILANWEDRISKDDNGTDEDDMSRMATRLSGMRNDVVREMVGATSMKDEMGKLRPHTMCCS